MCYELNKGRCAITGLIGTEFQIDRITTDRNRLRNRRRCRVVAQGHDRAHGQSVDANKLHPPGNESTHHPTIVIEKCLAVGQLESDPVVADVVADEGLHLRADDNGRAAAGVAEGAGDFDAGEAELDIGFNPNFGIVWTCGGKLNGAKGSAHFHRFTGVVEQHLHLRASINSRKRRAGSKDQASGKAVTRQHHKDTGGIFNGQHCATSALTVETADQFHFREHHRQNIPIDRALALEGDVALQIKAIHADRYRRGGKIQIRSGGGFQSDGLILNGEGLIDRAVHAVKAHIEGGGG